MTLKATPALVTVYELLAESLSEPPDWLAQAGDEWALYEAASELYHDIAHPAWQEAAVELAGIPSENLARRNKRYQQLLAGSTSRPLPIYESLALEGRLYGGGTLRVAMLYRAAGLIINGAELPDHASIELAFLAYLAQQEVQAGAERGQWRKVRREFIKQHAGRWLPVLGRTMARTSDPIYRPLGLLLMAVMQAEILPPRKTTSRPERRLPQLSPDKACTLCSFCVQVCPTQALTVRETFDVTALLASDAHCVSCDKCVRICPVDVLLLQDAKPAKEARTLFASPRARCPACASPTVSEAEVEAIAQQIGHPRWLDYCSECRIMFLEDLR